eukprot:scaffold359320_cov13-Prasinocladus_malaysianus.AAC.1
MVPGAVAAHCNLATMYAAATKIASTEYNDSQRKMFEYRWWYLLPIFMAETAVAMEMAVEYLQWQLCRFRLPVIVKTAAMAAKILCIYGT